jgi:hypothetical protein
VAVVFPEPGKIPAQGDRGDRKQRTTKQTHRSRSARAGKVETMVIDRTKPRDKQRTASEGRRRVAEKSSEIKSLAFGEDPRFFPERGTTKWRPSAGKTTEVSDASTGRAEGFNFR